MLKLLHASWYIKRCPACDDKGWLIVDIDSTGRLAIQRCDSCSQHLTDEDVRKLPEAQMAYIVARLQGGTDE
jgi:hypothetical protein